MHLIQLLKSILPANKWQVLFENYMAKNPYIDAEAPPPPKESYRLTIRNTKEVIEVDPAALP